MERTPPLFFGHGPAPLIRLLLCSLLSAALLISDARYQYLNGLRQVASVVIYPLQRLAGAPGAMLGALADFFSTHSALRNENARLAEQNLQYAVTLQKHRALQADNAHLRELLAARERFPESTLAAEVLYTGRDPFTRKIIIDKGWRHGIKAGQPAIDPVGVIGQVTRVYPWLAEITLITDKRLAVPVQNLRNGLRALLAGAGNDRLELRFIPLDADFQNGDQLVTSGIDGVYPPGLPVAVISSVERNATFLFARIICKPLAGVASYSRILVVNWENQAPQRPVEEEQPPRSRKPRRSG